MGNKSSNVMVTIHCLAYNHELFIRQCLDGFVMQKTNFHFVVIVHDDASTDGTANIIREYADKYPDIIKPIYQKENQYSKRDGSISRIMDAQTLGKYIAICEGDDYWIDPYKLQKQIDILEQNSEYTMCCSDAVIQTNNGILDWCRYPKSQDVDIVDIIINGGWFIQTASLVYRRNLLNDYPNYCRNCYVGDYPLMLWAGLNGKIYWFAEKQITYRYSIGNSWTSTYNKQDFAAKIKGWRSEIDMLQGLDRYSGYKYHESFIKRQVLFVRNIILNNQDKYQDCAYHFADVIKKYSAKEKIEDLLIKLHLYNYLRKLKSFLVFKLK